MNWLNVTLGIVLAIALVLQGVICVIRTERVTLIGVLNLLFAGASLVSCFLLRSGSLVMGTEFGIALVQGPWAAFLLRTVIVALCLCGGLLWIVSLIAIGQGRSRAFAAVVCSVAVLVGISAVSHFTALNAGGHFTDHSIAVRFYGMWYPPVVLWLLFCLAQTALTIAKTTGWLNCLWLCAVLISPVALYGFGWTEISDPWTSDPFSRSIWKLVLVIVVPVAVGLSIQQTGRHSRWRTAGSVVAAVLAALLVGVTLDAVDSSTIPVSELWYPVLWAFLLAAGARVAVDLWRLYRDRHAPAPREQVAERAHDRWIEHGRQDGKDLEDWYRAEIFLSRHPLFRYTHYCLTALLLLFAFCLFDFFYSSFLPSQIDMIAGFLAWFLLIEFLSEGAVSRIPEWAFRFAAGTSRPITSLLRKIRKRREERKTGRSAPSKEKEQDNAWGTALRATGRVLAAIVLLVGVSEATHIGSTVVEPFANPDDDAAKQRPGDQLANLLVSDLSRMRKDIPELIVISNSGAGGSQQNSQQGKNTDRSRPKLSVASEGSNLASAVPGSNVLDLFGLKIPAGSIAALVQEPIRYIFHIEEITGSIYKEKIDNKTSWRAVAVSNRGKVWRTKAVFIDDGPAQNQDGKDAPSPDHKSKANSPPAQPDRDKSVSRQASTAADTDGRSAQPGSGDGTVTGCERQRPQTPIEELAQDLASSISMGSPASGMTDSTEAFESFDRGVYHLNRFTRTASRAELRNAIQCFQLAVTEDRSFADAYYRLATALEKDGQPVRAAGALQAIANDKPIYVKAMLERANALFNLRTYYDLPQPVVVPPLDDYFPVSRQEPLHLWMQVALHEPGATAMERRAAYFGICQYLSDEETQQARQPDSSAPINAYLPYFFCMRAEALDNSIPLLDRNDPDAQLIEASILNQIGVSIGLHNQRPLSVAQLYARSDPFNDWRTRIMRRLLRRRPPPPQVNIVYNEPPVSGVFCDINAIDWDNLTDEASVPLMLWDSATAKRSMDYFAASQQLEPGDTTIVCNNASIALYSTGDMGPMLALKNDSRQRLASGEILSEVAHQSAYRSRTQPQPNRDGQLARLCYAMAVAQYQAATRIDGTSLIAADALGYAVWSWALDARVNGFDPPAPALIESVETNLRRTFQHFSLNVNVDDYLGAGTTLYELHIAQGRSRQAAEELTRLPDELPEGAHLDKASLPVSFYMDVAQAYVCASKVDAKQRDQDEKHATEALKMIEQIEGSSEFRPISDEPETFLLNNMKKNDRICFEGTPRATRSFDSRPVEVSVLPRSPRP